MSKALIFSAGVVTGVIATPIAVVYNKTLRHGFARGVAKIFTYGMRNNPDLRADTLKGFAELRNMMDQFEKDYGKFEDIF
jgi:hypothetical protein